MIRLLATVAVFAAMAGTAHADCTSPAGKAGALAYAGNFGVMAFCNGTQWVSMAGGVDVTINGSGSGALSGLSDVALTTPATGDFLNFNGTDWVNVSPFGTVTDTKWCVASSGRIECNTDAPLTSLSSIDDLADVDTSGAAPNSILAWNGSTWVVSATTIAETDPQVGTLTNSQWCTTDGNVINCSTAAPLTGSAVLNDLADVDTTGADSGKILAFDGTNWVVSDSTVAVSAGGNPTNVQFNNSGSFGGSDDFTWANSVLTVNGVVTATQVYASQVSASQGYIGALTGATGSLGGLTVTGDASISRVSASDISGTVLEMIGTTFTSLLGGSGNAIASATSSVSTSSDNTIKFATNGSQRMVIDATGQLGIGTTAPNALVDVAGLISTSSLTVNGVAITGGTSSQWTTTGSDIYYNTGNVGIGTPSPGAKLHLTGSASELLRLSAPSGDSTAFTLYDGGGNTLARSWGWRTNDSTWGNLRLYESAAQGTDPFAGTPRLTVLSGGNVGIGTTNPGVKLDVAGRINAYNSSSSARSTAISFYPLDTSGLANYGIGIGPTSSEGFIEYSSGSGSSSAFGHRFLVNGTNVLEIEGTGNIGIGTASPQQALDVSGILRSGDASSCNGATALAVRYGTLSEGATATFGSGRSECGPVLGRNVHPSSVSVGAFTSANPYNTSRNALVMGDELRYYTGAAQTVAIGGAVTMTERFRIDASGNVGIGTTGPSTKLFVTGSDADYTTTVQNTRGDATGNGLYVQTRWNVASNYIARFATNSGTNDVMAIKGDGKVGIGTTNPSASLHVAGNIMANGNIYPESSDTAVAIRRGSAGQLILVANSGGLYHQVPGPTYYLVTTSGGSTSDARVKKNVHTISNALAKVSGIRGVTFDFTDEYLKSDLDNAKRRLQLGVLAQEVEKFIPEAVQEGDDHLKKVSYEKLTPVLIEAVKELKAANDNLRTEHAAELKALRAEVEALKKAIQH